jgi:lipopolysaccharide biosynthesis regulator YciM
MSPDTRKNLNYDLESAHRFRYDGLRDLITLYQSGLRQSAEMLAILLDKQHFQAAADVWTTVQRGIDTFESAMQAQLLEAQEDINSAEEAAAILAAKVQSDEDAAYPKEETIPEADPE